MCHPGPHDELLEGDKTIFFKESAHHLDELTGFCFCFAARIIHLADHVAYSRQSAASQFCQPSASPPGRGSRDEMG